MLDIIYRMFFSNQRPQTGYHADGNYVPHSHKQFSTLGVPMSQLPQIERTHAMGQNGRIHLDNNSGTPFHLYEQVPAQATEYTDALKGHLEESILSKLFFSAENIQIIQNGIRAGVYKMSKEQYAIGPQSEDVIKTAMRTFFMENAKHMPHHITEQIEELNNDVVQYFVPRIYNEVVAYMKYRHDITTLAVPLNLPQLSSVKGGRQVERGFRDIGVL
jgi:hypothetical protein